MAKKNKKSGAPVLKHIKVDSCWVFHFDGEGCSGCNAEYMSCFSPAWDIERLGFRNTGNPAYADILLVTGLIDKACRRQLTGIYRQLPEGSKVVAAGSCACTGGMFGNLSGVVSGIDSMIPVDVYVSGCASRPEALIDALIKARDEDAGTLEMNLARMQEEEAADE